MSDPGLSSVVQEILDRTRAGSMHDPDFAGLKRLLGRADPLVLDVGANCGQSIGSIKTMFPDAIIHSFEPNPACAAALDALAEVYRTTVVVHHHGLGATRSTTELYIPCCGDLAFTEEATSRPDYFEKPWVIERLRQRAGWRLEQCAIELRPGDELHLSPDLIKIDVEGAEFDVLVGLIETIQRCRPALLVENSAWNVVRPFLRELEYVPLQWQVDEQRFAPYEGPTLNAFYVHQSRLADVVAEGAGKFTRLWQLPRRNP